MLRGSLAKQAKFAWWVTRFQARQAGLTRGRRLKPLYILSHMRSGSTLLVHILASNPEIAGFGEAHESYRARRDWLHFYIRYCLMFGEPPREACWLLDKMLFNRLELAPPFLADPAARFIFLLRNPEDSVPSLLRIADRVPEGQTPELATAYYRDRMPLLCNCAATISREQTLFIEHNRLLNNTAEVLASLTEWMGLAEPLTEEYKLMKVTGKHIIGDMSPHIKAGKVLRERPVDPQARQIPEILPELMAPAKTAFEEARDHLRSHCGTVA